MYLGWIDYGVLTLLLCLSAGIGIYHGCIRSRQLTANEFLIGDGRIDVLPTAMSLLASVTSAATLLGVPVEVYTYGTMYLYYIIGWLIGTYFTVYLFIPKFRQTGGVSIYLYLEKRFSLAVRISVIIVFCLIYIIYMAVVLYGPSSALSQVTGLQTWLAIGASGLICTFYTSVGGIKAVIWTDVSQSIMMFLGMIISIIFGIIDAGGIGKVFQTAMDGGRVTFFTVSTDPTVRYTVWSVIVGGSLYSLALCACLQTQAQRFMCVKSKRAAQRAAWINYALVVMMLLACAGVGFVLYAKYSHCDPLRAGLISKPDQLYPLFVIQTFGRFPGLTGLFIASILSASLSTISSGINSMTTAILEDVYKRIPIAPGISDPRQATVSKLLSILIGFLVTVLAFLISYLGNNIIVIVFQITGSLVTPILGVFLLGFFAPRVNSRSVLVAFFLCLVFQTWIMTGATLTAKQYKGQDGRLPTSVDRCSLPINVTISNVAQPKPNLLLPLYSISYLWYNLNGVLLLVIFGLLGTLVFGSNDPKTIDSSLLASWKDFFPCCLPKKLLNRRTTHKHKDRTLQDQAVEEERMLEN